MEVRNSLVEQNLGLVWKAVKYFEQQMPKDFDKDDLFQTGCIGLIRAAEKFDESYGYKFSTYAFPNIIGEIKTSLRDNRSIRVSRSMMTLVNKAAKAREKLQSEMGREAGIEELADYMECEKEELAAALCANESASSVTSITALEENNIGVDTSESEDDWAAAIDLKDRLSVLSNDEKKLFRLRYLKGYSQAETARIIKASQASVSRMEKALLMKVRNTA